MIKIISAILILLLFFFTTADAQSITGKIVDKENNPIEFATIVLQTQDSIFVNTTYSDSLGCFSFSENVNNFHLLVQHLMYDTYSGKFSNVEVGKIELKGKENLLSEIVVDGERPLVRVIDGKMTYDMPQLLKSKIASNAYEAIMELPGVSEQSDAIQLAGSNGVTVIINGKPTTMTQDQLITLLKNMPKERIQSAEIMYSAPPQYHVRGAAINLILVGGTSKENHFQGQINTAYNQGHYAQYQGRTALMFTTPKTSTDFMYSFDYGRTRNGDDILSHHLYDSKIYDIEQYDRGSFRIPTHNIRLGNDWCVNDKNKISFVYTAQIKQWSHSYNSSKGTYSETENKKISDKPIQMHNFALSYTSGFGLSTGIDYTYYRNHTTQYYQEDKIGKEDAFDAKAKQDIKKISFYADQSQKLGNNWNLNYGTKFSYASDNSSQTYDSSKGIDLSSLNSENKTNEYTYDLYARFSKSFSEKLNLSASFTGEYYKHQDADYWSLFPTLEMTYVSNPSNIFQLSISSDKEYPSYWEMQDAISYLNGYAEIHGNSSLKPSKCYSSQLNYILRSKYIFTLYTDYIDDNFNQLPYQSPERLALIYKTLNWDYSAKLGLNIILPFKINSILDSRLTLNGYYDKVKSKNFHDISFDNDNFAFYTNLNNTLNISSKPNIKAELSGSYITRNIQGPMTLSSMYRVDAGIKWTFANNNAELSLKANDLFNSWNPKNLDLDYQTQNLRMHLIPDSRRLSIAFTYKFGGFKKKEYKEFDSSRFGK